MDGWTLTTPQPDLETSSKQHLAIATVAVIALVSLLANAVLFTGQIILRRPKSGFDILVLNQLFVNFCLTLFIYPYDVIAYIILDRQWPFSGAFCYIRVQKKHRDKRRCITSTFFTSFLPFLGCWCAAIMSLHQLFAFFGVILECSCSPAVGPTRTVFSWLRKLGPTAFIWLQGFGIHCPIAYSLWTVHQIPTLCSLDGENGLLHDSIWYFWIPFSASCFTLTSILVVKVATNVNIPGELRQSVNPVVHYSVASHDGPPYGQFSPTVLSSDNYEQLDARLVQVDKAAEHPTENSQDAEDRVEPDELQVTNIWTAVIFTTTLTLFTGPYCIFLMMFHFVDLIGFELNLIYWDVGFTLMCCRPLLEPFVLLLFAKYRRGAAFWRWCR